MENSISFLPPELKQIKRKILLFQRRRRRRRCLSIRNENKQCWDGKSSSQKKKIKYRWENHSPKKEKRKANERTEKSVFHLRQYFFSSSPRLFEGGGFILSQVGKSVFHIKIIFASLLVCVLWNDNKIAISSASDDVARSSQMCGILEVSFIILRMRIRSRQ